MSSLPLLPPPLCRRPNVRYRILWRATQSERTFERDGCAQDQLRLFAVRLGVVGIREIAAFKHGKIQTALISTDPCFVRPSGLRFQVATVAPLSSALHCEHLSQS